MRMRKGDPYTLVGEVGKPQLPLAYPYYTVHHNEGALYTLKKWDDGAIEPTEEYMVNLKPISCSCPGMRHFYSGHREEEHKHIRLVRMFCADAKIDVGTFVLRAYWLDKKDNILSRVLMTQSELTS